jgi:hypothetical protein
MKKSTIWDLASGNDRELTNLVDMRERRRDAEAVGPEQGISVGVPLRLLQFTGACPTGGEGRHRGKYIKMH